MLKRLWGTIAENKHMIYFAGILFLTSVGIGYIFIEPNHPYIKNAIEQIKGIAETIQTRDSIYYMIYIIFLNNLSIAFLMILSGFLFGIIPILILISNGIFIGVILNLMLTETGQSFGLVLMGILPHGILEIPAIIIAAGFGIKVGVSVLNTIIGLLSRQDKKYNLIQMWRIIKQIPLILFGLMLMLFIAAIIESTLTRYLIIHFS